MQSLLAVVIAYLIGSIPFALVSSWMFGLADPRGYGSGNPGATNVLRSGNKKAAIVTLIGDAFKGWLAVWMAGHWSTQLALTANDVALVGIAVFLGHVFSLFLRFKGGKGVATALGVLCGFSPLLALGCLIAWLATALITRYSSAAG